MDISRIQDRLYHGTYPDGPDYEVLADLGIGLVINMQARRSPARHPAVAIPNLWLRTNDNPITRIPIYDLARGALAAREVIDGGGKVFVHCRQGRHRSSAMVACILVTQGTTAADAVALIKKQRPRANPNQWYIRERIVRFERIWTSPRVERSNVLLQLGRDALDKQDLARAARTTRLAIAANPRNADAWAQQHEILTRAGRGDADRFKSGEQWLRALQAPAARA